jgi:phosphate transport system permease protein
MIWASAAAALLVLAAILFFILKEGLPLVNLDFLFALPRKMGREGGIFSTVVGTAALTLLAISISTPLSLGTAIYLTEYQRQGRIISIIRFGVGCLAGVPSIIFGLFGFVFFVIFLNFGWSILSGGLTLAAMILPTIIRTSEEAIKAVPQSYRDVSYSLGGSHWQTIWHTILPSALPGIVTGVILGIGRSVGETAAVIFTAGSSIQLPTSLLSPSRTMAVHFYILAREGISFKMAYGTGAVLIIIILGINLLANLIIYRYSAKRS